MLILYHEFVCDKADVSWQFDRRSIVTCWEIDVF